MPVSFSSRWGFSFLSSIISLSCFALLALATIIWQLPPVKTLADSHMQAPLRIYSTEGDLIAEFGEKQRLPVALEDVPGLLVQAILSTEDQRFYMHNGVDVISLLRAIHSLATTGKKSQGASTITMQVARNFFLTRHKTFLRKFREILLALKLEQHLSKQQILGLYLNKIYFGQRAYGVAAAARNYYGKPLYALTLAQMAMIAGLPKAPSSNNPIANPEKAIKRRAHVLRKLYEQKYINLDEYQRANAAPITAKKHGAKIVTPAPYVAEMVRQRIVKKYGSEIAYNDGLEVFTSINTAAQIQANNAIKKGLFAYTKRHGLHKPEINLKVISPKVIDWLPVLEDIQGYNSFLPFAVTRVNKYNVTLINAKQETIKIYPENAKWALRSYKTFKDILTIGDVVLLDKVDNKWQLVQVPKVQAALISMKPKNGKIISLVGGFDYSLSHFNRVVQAKRQPGSCFKPFVYSAALDHNFNTASIINDAPIIIPDSGENLLWRPQNENNKFHGPTSFRNGLVHSRNLVSIRILRDIGLDYARHYISRFGFSLDQQPNSLSLALGSGTVTPLALNTAYASFANGGYKVNPILIDYIKDQKNNIIYKSGQQKYDRIISTETAFLISDILKDVVKHGSGRRALSMQRADVAGKTGTTNNKVDAWFAGFAGDVVTTVWVGFDKLNPLHEYGSKAALPIWIDYMTNILFATPSMWMKTPDNIVLVKINPLTGKRSQMANTRFEYFKKNQLPELEENIVNNNNSIRIEDIY